MSSLTVDLIQPKTIKEKVVRVETVIDDGYDEIIDLISDDQNNTEVVSSSVQFVIDESDDELDNEYDEESDKDFDSDGWNIILVWNGYITTYLFIWL